MQSYFPPPPTGRSYPKPSMPYPQPNPPPFPHDAPPKKQSELPHHLHSPQVSSAGTQTASPPTLTEHDCLHDLLLTEKNLGHGYTIASMEASNVELARMATRNLHDTQQAQQRLFQCLHKEGQYPVEGAPPHQVRQKAQQLSKMKQEFPYPH
ncbi:spore coat protein [Pasteuria penetrans]|uniref:spore coat protein n=1 Tax=Pasteuria penetrans TaxID=86005 RepID=UPI000FB4AAC5|nr:spore coat protein [Pasteuria penetrans]